MIDIQINGTAKNIDRDKMHAAIEFLAIKLMGRRLTNNIGIEVTLTKGLRRKKRAYAFCAVADDNYRPRYFDIEIDADLSQKVTLEALAHELVHVKQYARGELRESYVASRTKVFWKGNRVDADSIDYWELPWEIEAHGRERGLYLYLMQYFNDNGIN